MTTTLPPKIKNISLRRIAKRKHIKLSPEVLADNDQLFAALDEAGVIPDYARATYGPKKEQIIQEETIIKTYDDIQPMQYSNNAIFNTEDNYKEVDNYKAESDNYKAEVDNYKAESDNYKAEVDNYKAESDNYKEVDNYKAESDNYKAESDNYKAEVDNYKAESDNYIDGFKITRKIINGVEQIYVQKRIKAAGQASGQENKYGKIVTIYIGKIFSPDRAREKIKKYLTSHCV